MNQHRVARFVLLSAAVLALAFYAVAQSSDDSMQQCHHKDGAGSQKTMAMQQRGNQGMGFDQSKTTHHFRLTKDGGVIEVEANDPKDSESRDQIRMHLSHVARAFADGDFDIPMFVHDKVPDGVPVMKARSQQIQYRFETTENGGRVVISSKDPQALAAIHQFLAFQIREHQTGDDPTVR